MSVGVFVIALILSLSIILNFVQVAALSVQKSLWKADTEEWVKLLDKTVDDWRKLLHEQRDEYRNR